MAYVAEMGVSDSVITVRVRDLQETYNLGERTIYWYIDGEYDDYMPLDNLVAYSDSYDFTGLDPDTSYSIYALITYQNGDGSWGTATLDTVDISTNSPPVPIIDKWDWHSSNGDASSSVTDRAYEAVVGNGSTTDFSYKVWNDMVDKISEVIDAAGENWVNTFETKNNTKMSSSDKTLTATRYNSLRYNVGRNFSTGISEVQTGDPVLGTHFTDLMDAVNDWIDDL